MATTDTLDDPRLATVEDAIRETARDVTGVWADVKMLRFDVAGLGQRMDRLEARMDRLEAKVDALIAHFEIEVGQ